MDLPVPRWWWKGVIVGVALLAVGGALSAVEEGLRDIHAGECGYPYYGPPSSENKTPSDRTQYDSGCRSDRLQITWIDAAGRATFGPGIAVVVLAGVYLVAVAIARRKPE